jgi:DNA-binding CsgD family transcriptional regulator
VTPRERDVLRLISRGYTYAEVAGKLGLSVNTIAAHVKKAYRKLSVRSGAAAVTRAAKLRLLDDS